jgi:hypothetical protein
VFVYLRVVDSLNHPNLFLKLNPKPFRSAYDIKQTPI